MQHRQSLLDDEFALFQDISDGTYENDYDNDKKSELGDYCFTNNGISFMKKLKQEMDQLLQLIEIEKSKIPPNINLIQFYVNLHAIKIQNFRETIGDVRITTTSMDNLLG
eukprot:384024_1